MTPIALPTNVLLARSARRLFSDRTAGLAGVDPAPDFLMLDGGVTGTEKRRLGMIGFRVDPSSRIDRREASRAIHVPTSSEIRIRVSGECKT